MSVNNGTYYLTYGTSPRIAYMDDPFASGPYIQAEGQLGECPDASAWHIEPIHDDPCAFAHMALATAPTDITANGWIVQPDAHGCLAEGTYTWTLSWGGSKTTNTITMVITHS